MTEQDKLILKYVRKAIELTWDSTGEGFNGEWSKDPVESFKMVKKDVITQIKKDLLK